MFVGGVGGGRLIVLRNVGSWGRGEFIGRLRGDIVRLRRGRGLTVRGRTGYDSIPRWMIHLQKGWPGGL